MYPVSARKALTSSTTSDSSSKHVLKRATIMMGVASLALVLCWLPNQLYFLLAQLGYFELKPSIPVRVVGVLVFSNSFMNPVIYGFMNRNFRQGYRKLLMPWKQSSWKGKKDFSRKTKPTSLTSQEPMWSTHSDNWSCRWTFISRYHWLRWPSFRLFMIHLHKAAHMREGDWNKERLWDRTFEKIVWCTVCYYYWDLT